MKIAGMLLLLTMASVGLFADEAAVLQTDAPVPEAALVLEGSLRSGSAAPAQEFPDADEVVLHLRRPVR